MSPAPEETFRLRQIALPAYGPIAFGVGGAAELLLFYPAGLVMDRRGRIWAVVPTVVLLGLGTLLLPMMTTVAGLVVAATVMAVGSGLGSGIVKTLGADAAPLQSPAQFLAGWGILTQLGEASGPLAISAAVLVLPLGATLAGFGVVVLASVVHAARVVPEYAPSYPSRAISSAARSGARSCC